MAPTRDGQGYWLATVDGDVCPFGDAPSLGSLTDQANSAPVVGIGLDPATGGYWLVDSSGGVFGFDVPDLGSMAGQALNAPVSGMVGTEDGQGYWLVADDGGVFSFGDAVYAGNATDFGTADGSDDSDPVVAMSADLSSGGYWLVASDGDVLGCNAAVPRLRLTRRLSTWLNPDRPARRCGPVRRADGHRGRPRPRRWSELLELP